MPFGYSAIGGLLGQMEEAKRRMQQPLAPPPDAFQLPQQEMPQPHGGLMAQPQQPSGLMAQHGPAPTATDPFTNVANANISDPNDLSYQYRPGIRGATLKLLGADRVSPELQSLLSPDQIKRVKPGIVSSLWNAINYGIGPKTVMKARADEMLGLQDKKMGRDKMAALAQLQAAWTPVIFAAKTPEEIHQVQTGYANARAAILGPEAMGTAPNFLQALEPAAAKASDYELFQDPSGNAQYIPKGAKVPAGWTKDRADASDPYMTITDGSAYRNVPKSGEIPAGWKPWSPPQYGGGIVLPGTPGNPAQFVSTSGPNQGTVKPLPDTVDKSNRTGHAGFGLPAMKKQVVELNAIIRSGEAAIKEARKYPDAFGPSRAVGVANPFIDKRGNEARRQKGQVSSIVRNQIFGSALTGNEIAYARGWIPEDWQPTDKVIGDLESLVKWAKAKRDDYDSEIKRMEGGDAPAQGPPPDSREFKMPDGTTWRRK